MIEKGGEVTMGKGEGEGSAGGAIRLGMQWLGGVFPPVSPVGRGGRGLASRLHCRAPACCNEVGRVSQRGPTGRLMGGLATRFHWLDGEVPDVISLLSGSRLRSWCPPSCLLWLPSFINLAWRGGLSTWFRCHVQVRGTAWTSCKG